MSTKPFTQQDLDEAFEWEEPIDVILAFKSLIGEKYGEVAFDIKDLTEIERIVILVDLLRLEVINGGFEQYFTNSSGEYAIETLDLLHQIGATQVATLLDKALEIFPEGKPSRDENEHFSLIYFSKKRGTDTLALLDEKFFLQEDGLLITLRQYLQEHKSDWLLNSTTTGSGNSKAGI